MYVDFTSPGSLSWWIGFCSHLFKLVDGNIKYLCFLCFNKSILKHWQVPLKCRRIVASSIPVHLWRAFTCVHGRLKAIWFFLNRRIITSILFPWFMLLDCWHTWDGNFSFLIMPVLYWKYINSVLLIRHALRYLEQWYLSFLSYEWY